MWQFDGMWVLLYMNEWAHGVPSIGLNLDIWPSHKCMIQRMRRPFVCQNPDFLNIT